MSYAAAATNLRAVAIKFSSAKTIKPVNHCMDATIDIIQTPDVAPSANLFRRRPAGSWLARRGLFAIALLILGISIATGQGLTVDQADCLQISTLAGPCQCCLQPGDELWLINTRCMEESCNNCCDTQELIISQWCDGQWLDRQLDDLFASNLTGSNLANVVYIHGNFTDYGWSLRRGCEVYQCWFGQPCGREPIRFVIWSWKSERETVPGRDFRVKSKRAVAEGCRLNSVVSRLGPRIPFVIGYSLGAQATLSALNQNTDELTDVPWRVALIAVALDSDFCCQLQCNEQISSRLERLTVFTNALDPALNCSTRISRRSVANPLDQYSVLPNLPGGLGRFEQFEIDCEVGRHHSISRYRQSPTVVATVRQLLIELPPPPEQAD